MKILFNNRIGSMGVTSLYGDQNYPASNVQSSFLHKRFQSTLEYDTLTATFATPETVDMVSVGYHNKDAKIKVYEAGSTTYKYLVEDADSQTIPTTTVSKVEVELGDNQVENGEFYSGSTGWTLGTGAKGRQQGWVGRMSDSAGTGVCEAQTYFSDPITSGFTAGVTTSSFKVWCKKSNDYSATSTYLYLRFWNNSEQVISAQGLLISPTTSWAQYSISPSAIPVGTVKITASWRANAQSAGSLYWGFTEIYFDSVIVKYYDWSDGGSFYGNDSGFFLEYDPANAYMGNAMPGGSGMTLVVGGDVTGYTYTPSGSFIPVTEGQSITLTASVREIVETLPSADYKPRVHFYSGNSYGTTYIGSLTLSGSVTGSWSTLVASGVIPAGANYAAVILADPIQSSGLWLIGSVKVYRLNGMPAYLGGVGVGQGYSLKSPESFWEETFDDRSIVSESQSGQVLQEYVEPLKTYEFRFPGLTRDEARDFEATYLQYGKGKPMFVDFETDDLQTLYCRLTDAISVSKNKKQYNLSIKLLEAR